MRLRVTESRHLRAVLGWGRLPGVRGDGGGHKPQGVGGHRHTFRGAEPRGPSGMCVAEEDPREWPEPDTTLEPGPAGRACGLAFASCTRPTPEASVSSDARHVGWLTHSLTRGLTHPFPHPGPFTMASAHPARALFRDCSAAACAPPAGPGPVPPTARLPASAPCRLIGPVPSALLSPAEFPRSVSSIGHAACGLRNFSQWERSGTTGQRGRGAQYKGPGSRCPGLSPTPCVEGW